MNMMTDEKQVEEIYCLHYSLPELAVELERKA
jgi:hypothetical protein